MLDARIQVRISKEQKARLQLACGPQGMNAAILEAIEGWLERRTLRSAQPAKKRMRGAKPVRQLSPGELLDRLDGS